MATENCDGVWQPPPAYPHPVDRPRFTVQDVPGWGGPNMMGGPPGMMGMMGPPGMMGMMGGPMMGGPMMGGHPGIYNNYRGRGWGHNRRFPKYGRSHFR